MQQKQVALYTAAGQGSSWLLLSCLALEAGALWFTIIAGNSENSGYISASNDLSVALNFALKKDQGIGLFIKKNASENKAVRINQQSGREHKYTYEEEIAFRRQIPSENITGGFRVTKHSDNAFSIGRMKFNKNEEVINKKMPSPGFYIGKSVGTRMYIIRELLVM